MGVEQIKFRVAAKCLPPDDRRKVRVTPHAEGLIQEMRKRTRCSRSVAACVLIDQGANGVGAKTRDELGRILLNLAKHVGGAMGNSLPTSRAHRELREATAWLEQAQRVLGCWN